MLVKKLKVGVDLHCDTQVPLLELRPGQDQVSHLIYTILFAAICEMY